MVLLLKLHTGTTDKTMLHILGTTELNLTNIKCENRTADSDTFSAYNNNMNEIVFQMADNMQMPEYKIDIYYLQVSGGGRQQALPA